VLVIHRRPGESLLIGDNVEIQVIDVAQGRVRLGISAPSEVVVLRKEIHLAREANIAAARGVSSHLLERFVTSYRAKEDKPEAPSTASAGRPSEDSDENLP
jgi:carbon storage regulator